MKIKPIKNKLIFLAVFAISLLFISSATAVPQSQGAIVVDQIDELQTQKEAISFLDSLKNKEFTKEEILQLIDSVTSEWSSKINEGSFSSMSANILPADSPLLDILKALLTNLLSMLFDQSIWDIFNPDIGSGNSGGLLEQLIQALMLLFTIPVLIVKALAKGVVVLAQGLIRVLGALIAIIVFIFSGIQTFLTLLGFVILFIGVMSKIGFQFFAALGAPIFALLSIFTSLSFGKMLGGISMILSSLTSVAVIFALPLLFIFLILPFIMDTPEFDFEFNEPLIREGGLLYMIASVFASFFTSS